MPTQLFACRFQGSDGRLHPTRNGGSIGIKHMPLNTHKTHAGLSSANSTQKLFFSRSHYFTFISITCKNLTCSPFILDDLLIWLIIL